jgi:hypothetical protein
LLAQQTIILKNLGKQKKGIFSLPQLFCWSAYYQVPKMNDRPMSSGVFRLRLDHGLQECFETAAGVGLAGMKADRDEKTKGLSLLWVIPALILGGTLLVKLPLLLAKGISGATMGAAKVAAESYKFGSVITNQSAETPGLFPSTQTNPLAIVPSVKPVSPSAYPVMARQSESEKSPEVFLTGVTTFGGRAVVHLSNGEVFTSDDRELEFASKRMAIVSGRKFVFPPLTSRSKELPAPQRDLFKR